jgi:hypothetical protein
MEGDTSLHGGDHSSADLALLTMFSFYTRDPGQLERLFGYSVLANRGKWWDRPDYRTRTIEAALKFAKEQYETTGGNCKSTLVGDGEATHGFHQQERPSTEPINNATAAQIITQYWRTYYEPTFRLGLNLYSAKFSDVVKPSNMVITTELIDLLQGAKEAQRDDNGKAIPSRLPALFHNWKSVAWGDLIEDLPTEQESAEIVDDAKAEFQRQVAPVFYAELPLGREIKDAKEVVSRIERRSLIDWCQMFAKRRFWRDIRGRLCWCMIDTDGRLRVALRLGLFGQVGKSTLAPMTPKRFIPLALRYDVIVPNGPKLRLDNGKQRRAIELSPDFISELLAQPEMEQPTEDARDTRTQGQQQERCGIA